jgi:hypothetical protein
MPQKLLSFALFFLLIANAAGQTPTPGKPAEDAAKLEKDAIELLRETSAEVGRLRTLENRISFNSELASLMWFHDHKEAKAMYGQVVAEFKQLLSQFDTQMNSLEVPDENEMGGIFGSYGRSKVERKFQIAMAVRKQIAMSLAEHAPDLAYNFYFDSLNSVTNTKLREQAQASDKYFEHQLIERIAESDAAKGVEYGKESLKGGIDGRHVALLKKIYAKNIDRGIEFGSALLSRLKSEKAKAELYPYSELLSFGSANFEESKKPGGKKPVYSQNDLRDIAELFATAILETDEALGYRVVGYAELIEKFSPGRAAQIRAKVDKLGLNNSNVAELRAIEKMASNSVGSIRGVGSGAATNANIAAGKWKEEQDAREKREKELMEGIQGVAKKELSKEERDKVVARSRAIIATMPGKDKKIGALSMLAAQVARAGDKELADEIMRDAERLVNPQPKNYQDFLLSLMLAAGYAEADPDKAFPLLETLILRQNDLSAASIKLAEFIDVNGEFVDDGEIQIGMFGGEMIRGMTTGLGIANTTILSLAKADFVKTTNLTNTFDRTETRVLAKMLVLRAILAKGEPAKTPEQEWIEANSDVK